MKLFFLFSFLFLSTPFSLAGVSIVSMHEALRAWESLQIVDARDLSDYLERHLPGAVHMDWKDYKQKEASFLDKVFGEQSGLVLEDIDVISRRMTKLRLREDLPILVYGGNGPWGDEGRVAWNLLYWGAKDVRLLNGGVKVWKERVATLRPVLHPQKSFRANLDPRRRIRYSELKASLKKGHVYDVRSMREFNGARAYGVKGGKIPSALHFDDRLLYDEDGHYIEALKLLKEIPELPLAEVTYCTGGVRSALAALLIEAYTGKLVRNYDGSMWEWQARE